MTGREVFLTIDAGGTFIKSAVLSTDGVVLDGSAVSSKAFSDGTKEEILKSFQKTILQSLKFSGIPGVNLGGIGVAFPGPFDYQQGIPLMGHKFSNIYGVDMRMFFGEISGISPDIPIRFIHDAQAVLLGELWKGNAQGFPDAAAITLGTGLGFAFSKNGIVQSTPTGGPLVSIFKLPYKDGILEDYVARRGLLKIYSEICNDSVEGIDVSDLGKWANDGEENSINTFHEVGRILAESLHNILLERGIQCLLLGGQISRSFDHLEETLKQGLEGVKSLRKISVVSSIDNASLLGALRAVQNSNFK